MHFRFLLNDSHDPLDGAVILGVNPVVYGKSPLECSPFVEAAYHAFNKLMPEEYRAESLKHWQNIFGQGWKPINGAKL
eukprot:8919411-Ditylum_brightwellii.AAC.2